MLRFTNQNKIDQSDVMATVGNLFAVWCLVMGTCSLFVGVFGIIMMIVGVFS